MAALPTLTASFGPGEVYNGATMNSSVPGGVMGGGMSAAAVNAAANIGALGLRSHSAVSNALATSAMTPGLAFANQNFSTIEMASMPSNLTHAHQMNGQQARYQPNSHPQVSPQMVLPTSPTLTKHNPAASNSHYNPTTSFSLPQQNRPPQQCSVQDQVATHVYFPVALYLASELTASPPYLTPAHREELSQLQARAREVSSYGERYGWEAAAKHYPPMELFFSCMLGALKSLGEGRIPAPEGSLLEGVLKGMSNSSNLLSGRRLNGVMKTKRMGPRNKHSPAARQTLENWFNKHITNPYPGEKEKEMLAMECGLTIEQVNNFFGNKRMRLKRKAIAMKEGDDRANTSRSGESVLAPRSKWRSLVLSTLPGVQDEARDDDRITTPSPFATDRSSIAAPAADFSQPRFGVGRYGLDPLQQRIEK